ncbi:MAG: hypothetical protein QM820_22810 [Minicystis sp.]
MSEAPQVYDAVELRRRIVVAFTPGELRELAEQLGVGGSIAWERGAQEAARELVKQCERYAGLPALVAKLREMRPLVEWPEPVAGSAPAAFPEAPPLVPLPGVSSAETTQSPAEAPSGTIANPFAPPPGATPTIASAPAPGAFAPAVFPTTPGAPVPAAPPAAAVPRPAAPAPPPPSPSPVWPGMAAPPAPQQRGIDPRILVAVAGLMLLAAVIAYLAGRASNAQPTSSATPAASNAPPRRGDGPAALAADTLERSLDNLARTCEQRPAGSDGELVFRRVFERCGPAPLPVRPYSPPLPSTPPDPSAAPDEPREPAPRTKRPARGGGAPAPDAPQPARGCMGACDADHRSCVSRCGPEPTDGASEEGYRRCLGRCLADVSRCRLGCR